LKSRFVNSTYKNQIMDTSYHNNCTAVSARAWNKKKTRKLYPQEVMKNLIQRQKKTAQATKTNIKNFIMKAENNEFYGEEDRIFYHAEIANIDPKSEENDRLFDEFKNEKSQGNNAQYQEDEMDLSDNPYDSENLDDESGSEFKDITKQDIENDLRNHDSSEEFESTDSEIDDPDSNEFDTDQFENNELGRSDFQNKEFDIGELSNNEIKNDEFNHNEIDLDKFDNEELANNSYYRDLEEEDPKKA
jgi:hypothetical protein